MDTATLTSARNAFKSRLKAQVERLMAAVETMPPPQTSTDIQKFARALMLADKAVSQILADPKPAKASPKASSNDLYGELEKMTKALERETASYAATLAAPEPRQRGQHLYKRRNP